MAIENKPLSERDAPQIQKKVYNESNATLGVDGYLVGKIGNRVVKVNTSATIETLSFYEDHSTLLYQYTITYTDSTKSDFAEVERTA